ncbi:hypothetical protein GGF46_000897 [Coemansia sp. RSA 552]|nr:hypothetical protein GGF46_000897 [Coemansia sp. RSA 552]
MLSSSQRSVLKDIDAARCVGRWSAATALASKLSKHGSPGHVFASIVASEADLEEHLLTVEWDAHQHWKDEGCPGDGTQLVTRLPMNISHSGTLLDAIEKRMRKAAKHTMTLEEEYQFNVVLAKIHFYAARFDQCRKAIASLPATIPGESTLSPEYTKQLYMALMVMRGIISEIDGDLGSAHATYEKAIVAFTDKLSSQATVVIPRGSGHGSRAAAAEELINWPEEALYRRAMMSLALGDAACGLRELSSYITTLDSVTPASFRAFRRVRANRLYLRLIRRRLEAAPAAQPSQLQSAKPDIMLGHRRQMALLRASYTFPQANEAHDEVLAEVDNAARDWELVRAFSRSDTLRLLEILYESVYITFNSPRVLRHLIHALIRFGDYHEASLAFGTYRMLVGRQLEGVKKALAAATSEGSDTGAVRNVFGVDTESINNVLRTVVVGARLFMVQLGNAHECLSLAHFAADLISDMEASDPEHKTIPPVPQSIVAQMALWKGAAHGYLAQKSREPGNRADHHAAALQLLQQAVDQSPRLYDAHYYLALELALGARDVAAATISAKEAVGLDPKRLEAWHLLVLLSTARKDYAKALQICKVAMKQSEWWGLYSEIRQGAPKDDAAEEAPPARSTPDLGLSKAGSLAHYGNVETGIAFFDLATTQMMIEGRHKGFDASLEMQPHLFTLYGRVYGPVIGSGDELDDVASAMESTNIGIDTLTLGDLRTGHHGLLPRRRISPSQVSGRQSLARSLARSVFSRHIRYSSHGGSGDGDHPPLPFTAIDGAPNNTDKEEPPGMRLGDGPKPNVLASRESDEPKRQRSMPHLRQASTGSSAMSPEIPTEAYFDNLSQFVGRVGSTNGGARSNSVAEMQGSSSVYYTPVPTRLGHQRDQAKRALCSLWLATATAFTALQRLDDAANAVAEALVAWPESPEALTVRGQLAVAQRQYLPALNEFHAAVSLESSNIRASVSLAHAEYLLGRRDVALGLLKNITRAHGWSDPEAWYLLGRLERELALEQADPAGADPQERDGQARMMRRALEYISYALDLENSQPARPFSVLSAALDGIGYGTIAAAMWNTYCRATGNRKAAERLELRASIMALRRDLRTVSSVDEFAKWAKMRRRLDSMSTRFEGVSSDLALERTAFELYVNMALRAVVYGLRAVVNLYNYRVPVFYVPANWFYPVLWFLSLPAAPMGSRSSSIDFGGLPPQYNFPMHYPTEVDLYEPALPHSDTPSLGSIGQPTTKVVTTVHLPIGYFNIWRPLHDRRAPVAPKLARFFTGTACLKQDGSVVAPPDSTWDSRISYSSADDEYYENGVALPFIKGWDHGVLSTRNIFRKVEHDWLMTYLAPVRGDSSHQSLAVWRFNYSGSRRAVDRFHAVLSFSLFSETAAVEWCIRPLSSRRFQKVPIHVLDAEEAAFFPEIPNHEPRTDSSGILEERARIINKYRGQILAYRDQANEFNDVIVHSVPALAADLSAYVEGEYGFELAVALRPSADESNPWQKVQIARQRVRETVGGHLREGEDGMSRCGLDFRVKLRSDVAETPVPAELSQALAGATPPRRMDDASCDFTIHVNDPENTVGSLQPPIRAHEQVLQAGSEYFSGLLSSEMAESASKSVTLDSMPYHAVRTAIYFLYTDTLPGKDAMDVDDWIVLLGVASRLSISRLHQLCQEHILREVLRATPAAPLDHESYAELVPYPDPETIDAVKAVAGDTGARDLAQALDRLAAYYPIDVCEERIRASSSDEFAQQQNDLFNAGGGNMPTRGHRVPRRPITRHPRPGDGHMPAPGGLVHFMAVPPPPHPGDHDQGHEDGPGGMFARLFGNWRVTNVHHDGPRGSPPPPQPGPAPDDPHRTQAPHTPQPESGSDTE